MAKDKKNRGLGSLHWVSLEGLPKWMTTRGKDHPSTDRKE